MKKNVKKLILVLLFILIFNVTAFAKENDDYKNIIDEVGSSTQDLLENAGINDVDFDELFNLSPRKVIDLLVGVFRGQLKQPVRSAGIVMSIAVLSALFRTLCPKKLSQDSYYSFAEGSVIIISVIIPLSESITSSASSVKLLSDFMLTYIPVFTGVVSASGQAMSAFAYSGVMLTFSELCAKASTLFLIPLITIITTVNVFAMIDNNSGATQIVKVIKRIVTVLLTIVSGVFVGLVNIKSNLAAAADSVAVKGVRLLSGSVIPVIGGALGEALTSVLATFSMIKSTIGVFGIIAIILIVLPSVVQLLCWYFSLLVCSLICSAAGNDNMSNVMSNLSSCVSLINIIVLFTAMVFILSTGIILSVRG